jgi:hypothetical protein
VTTTGYSDTFGRTVAAGLGTATSGQPYTLFGAASQFSVAPNTASIAISSAGDKIGYIDFQTQNVIDITAQVAVSAIPATNLATAGIAAKLDTGVGNYYVGSMMVQTLGLLSLRFSKVVAGSLVTISTTLVGAYTAGDFYNLRYSIYWSYQLQTNVMSLKLWAVGAVEPGGWMATATDASLTAYTSGTHVGIHGRDESTSVGSITTRYRNVSVRSYALPMPAGTDPMCADPAVAYPKQTALESLALASDVVMASLDPLTSLAALFPRVRVSNSNLVLDTSVFPPLTFNTTEFNIGTDTNLGYDNDQIYLPVGIWLLAFEIQLAEATTNYMTISFNGGPTPGRVEFDMRSNAAQLNDQGVGGCGHGSSLTYSTDPTTPIQVSVSIFPNNTATTYTVKYMALSAIKISDYFA